MSGWPKLLKAPTVTITPDGKVRIAGYRVTNCSCREAAQLGMVWAVGKLQKAIIENMTADSPDLSGLD